MAPPWRKACYKNRNGEKGAEGGVMSKMTDGPASSLLLTRLCGESEDEAPGQELSNVEEGVSHSGSNALLRKDVWKCIG